MTMETPNGRGRSSEAGTPTVQQLLRIGREPVPEHFGPQDHQGHQGRVVCSSEGSSVNPRFFSTYPMILENKGRKRWRWKNKNWKSSKNIKKIQKTFPCVDEQITRRIHCLMKTVTGSQTIPSCDQPPNHQVVFPRITDPQLLTTYRC